MKLHKLAILAFFALPAVFVACDDDNNGTDDQYVEWYNQNAEWLAEKEDMRNADGTAYYTKVVAPWNPGAYVLMHYYENPDDNKDNLVPLYTSTVDVRYKVYLCDDTPLDSSTNITSPVAGAYRTPLNSESLIAAWPIAITHMHVGDTCEVIVPYSQAYGISGYGNIDPYSNLRFNLRLVDIPYYEVKQQ